MDKLEQRVEDWERIREIFKEAIESFGIEKQESYREAYKRLKEYNEKYGTKFDFFNKQNESK